VGKFLGKIFTSLLATSARSCEKKCGERLSTPAAPTHQPTETVSAIGWKFLSRSRSVCLTDASPFDKNGGQHSLPAAAPSTQPPFLQRLEIRTVTGAHRVGDFRLTLQRNTGSQDSGLFLPPLSNANATVDEAMRQGSNALDLWAILKLRSGSEALLSGKHC
jgi:hypothetical protein